MANARWVSVHGGHTAEFGDGRDTLPEVVREYVRKGFAWVGITEHIPPVSDELLFEDDREAGETAETRGACFNEYFSTARMLQAEHEGELVFFVGFETECCTGYVEHVKELRSRLKPDYIVGSVHHVRDMVIDGRAESYSAAATKMGGIQALYCEYFDQQFEMMELLNPEVVGHFDLIRMHDENYRERLEIPDIKNRIRRNLERAKDIGAILDFNLAALDKGASEPYVSRSILETALDIGVPCVPGDDSHGVITVGRHMETGIGLLEKMGFETDWPMPRGCG